MTCEEPGFRLLLGDLEYASSEETQDVWCYRFLRIHGHVALERPDRAPDGSVFVAARPATPGRAPRGDPAVGTSAWVEKMMWKSRLAWKTIVREGLYEIEVPVLRDMRLAASAPGHVVRTRPVGMAKPDLESRDFDFFLKTGATVSVRVTDDAGNPIGGAQVRLISTFQVPTAELNLEELRLRKRAGGGSFGAIGNDATGMTTVRFTAGRRADGDGGAELTQTASEGKLILMITAGGYEPFLEEVMEGTGFLDRTVSMARITPVRAGYRLLWKGKYVVGGAGLQLFLMTEGLSLNVAAISSDPNGVFPSRAIVPGREYYALLFDHGEVGHRNGWIRFGSEEVVDISTFE